ncbi:MAG: hypothetical protein FGF50_11230 [Candidatus Brockarchaeota archaeon]|nr:hypothetical protein [Candidatus Brockarchaeota archaeon]
MSYRIMIQRVIDRILLKFPFKPPVSIFPLGWLLLSLAYFLGILLKRFKPRGRIPRLLAMAFSLVSMLLFTLWFALTLEPPYVVQLLTLG